MVSVHIPTITQPSYVTFGTQSSNLSFTLTNDLFKINVLTTKYKIRQPYMYKRQETMHVAWYTQQALLKLKSSFLLQVPPTITQSPEIATFSCTATGSPRPTITWWRVENGTQTQIVAMDGAYYIADQELGVERISTLIIIEADPSDTGLYLCLAENEAGTDNVTAELTVHGKCE